MNPSTRLNPLMFAKPLLTFAALLMVGCSDNAAPHDSSQAGSAGTSSTSAGSSPAAGAAGGLGVSGGGSGSAEAGGGGQASNGGSVATDDALIVPQGLDVSVSVGNNSIFSVVALTLRDTSSGPQLYAAVKNEGDAPGCNVSFSVTLYDKDEQTVGAGVSGLVVRRFYELKSDDGSSSIAGCVSPGDVTMLAIVNLDLGSTPIADVRKVVYSTQYWYLANLVAIDGVTLKDVTAVNKSKGVAYTGALVNELDKPLSNPTVAIFPLNAVGRPLGVAYGRATLDVAPGASWAFETETVTDAGVGFDAYPLGGS